VKRFAWFSAAAVLWLSAASGAFGQPTEAGLVAAWEQGLRSDPETIRLEKQAEGSYRFATKRFPFDGELKVLKATVEEANATREFIPGIVEVELVGLPEKVLKDYERSYSYWQRGNLLYYDVPSKRWLAGKEFQESARRRAAIFGGSLWSWVPTLLLILFLVFLLGMIARAQGRQKMYTKRVERSLEISERMLQLSEKTAQTSEKTAQTGEQRLEILQARQEKADAYLDRAAERSDRILEISEKNSQLVTDSLQVLKEIRDELRKRPL
jgi:hypothetical protein